MKIFHFALLIFPAFLLTAASCFAQAPEMMMKPTPVLVTKVTETLPSLGREYRGAAEAIESVRVIARVQGRLEEVNFAEGDVVEKGAPLFRIEDTEYTANLRSAKAQVVSCESTIKETEAKIAEINAKIVYAQANYDRCKQLYENGRAGSADDVDNALAELDSQKAQLEAAKAGLTNAEGQLELAKSKVDLAEFQLSHTIINSQIKGRAGRLNYTQGNYITPNDGALVTISQLDPIYVRFSISETDFVSLFESADALRNGTILKIRLADNSLYQGKGKIKFIDNQITNLDTLQVWAEFENPNGLITPGGITKVLLTKPGTRSYPSIPASGVIHLSASESEKNTEDSEKTAPNTPDAAVYTVVEKKGENGEPNYYVHKKPIKLGPAVGNTQCIESGLEPGDVIVIGGVNKINPMMLVDEEGKSVINPETPPLQIKPVYNQEELDIELGSAASPAGPPAGVKGTPKNTAPAEKPNGGPSK